MVFCLVVVLDGRGLEILSFRYYFGSRFICSILIGCLGVCKCFGV